MVALAGVGSPDGNTSTVITVVASRYFGKF